MRVKRMRWMLRVLLVCLMWPAGAPSAWASDCVNDTWAPTSLADAPSGRDHHTAVWTGTEMIVWGGGTDTGVTDTGGRYNPAADAWLATSLVNAPDARSFHTAVWTGTEMIVWGGSGRSGSVVIAGSRYNPATDTWTAISTINAPIPQGLSTAVWTGLEMLVWGGSRSNIGGRYNPATDTWAAISTVNAPSPRVGHSAVWTGTEMIVWGGLDGDYPTTGGRYNPATDTWVATSTEGAPIGRDGHTAVWTGTQMIVWGGQSTFTDPISGELIVDLHDTGGRYDPATDTWTSTNRNSVPRGRSNHSAVWTGTEMIVWGGIDGTAGSRGIPFATNTGGRYDPTSDTWRATSGDGAPFVRFNHTAVWDGAEMLAWGGVSVVFDPETLQFTIIEYNDGGRYCAGAQ